MAKKLDYGNLGSVNVVTTQNRIAPSPDMPPINRDELKMIEPTAPVVAPAAAPQVTVTPAPTVIEAVKPAEPPAISAEPPSVSPDGTPAVSPSVNANAEENDSELTENELPEGIRKRFSKLTSKRKEADKKAEELAKQLETEAKERDSVKKELEFYKNLLLDPKTQPPAQSQGVAQPTQPPAPVQTEKVPVFEDFANEADPITAFVDAKANYIVNKRLAPMEHQLDPVAQDAKRKFEAVKAVHPDYDEVVTMNNPAIKMLAENPIINAMVPRSKDNMRIAYYLGKNQAEAQKLALLNDPIDIAIEIRKIQEKIATPVQTQQTAVVTPAPVVPAPEVKPITRTSAPEPFKPVNSAGSPGLPPVDSLSPDQMRDDPRYSFLKKKRY
jgi:hypothetical protein